MWNVCIHHAIFELCMREKKECIVLKCIFCLRLSVCTSEISGTVCRYIRTSFINMESFAWEVAPTTQIDMTSGSWGKVFETYSSLACETTPFTFTAVRYLRNWSSSRKCSPISGSTTHLQGKFRTFPPLARMQLHCTSHSILPQNLLNKLR